MPAVTAAILFGVGAAGAVGGQFLGGSPDVPSPSDAPAAGFTPFADPLLAQLQLISGAEFGLDPSSFGGAGSPTGRFLNAIGSGAAGDIRQEGMSVASRIVNNVNQTVSQGVSEGLSEEQIIERVMQDPETSYWWQIRSQGASAAGFTSFEDMIRSQISFQTNRNETISRLTGLQPELVAGREAAQRGISQILQDFPIPTRAELDRLAGTFEADLRRQRLTEANVGGFPADLRNIGREGLQQATELLGSRTALAGGALSSLQAAETQRLLNALAVQERGQAAQLGAAELAGAQSRALAGLRAEGILQRNQQEFERAQNIANIFGTIGGLGAEGLIFPEGRYRRPATGDTD